MAARRGGHGGGVDNQNAIAMEREEGEAWAQEGEAWTRQYFQDQTELAVSGLKGRPKRPSGRW